MALTLPLKVKDETDQVYLERNLKSRYKAMEETLERFKDLDPKGVFMILTGEDIRELEGVLRVQVRNPESLKRECQRLVTVDVGGFTVPLTDLQMQVLKERASYWNREDPRVYIQEELVKALNHMCFGRYEVPVV